jgi:hypothetical protein
MIARHRLWDQALLLLGHIQDGLVSEDEVIAALTEDNDANRSAANAGWLRENFRAIREEMAKGAHVHDLQAEKPSWTTTGPPYLREAKP